MPGRRAKIMAFAADITAAAFPTPATAMRTNDPARVAIIYAFAEKQAAAARSLLVTFARKFEETAPANTTGAVTAVLSAAAVWRHRLAVTSEQSHAEVDRQAMRQFRTAIRGNHYIRIGYDGRAREQAIWEMATSTFAGGTATPAHHTLALFGQYAIDRFQHEAPNLDVLQNVVYLGDGSVVMGNLLLRRRAAAAASRQIAAQGHGVWVETGGSPVYIQAAKPADRERLYAAAIAAFVEAIEAADAGDAHRASRQWAFAAYCLYQAPQTRRGYDAVVRVALVTLGVVALRRVPQLPHDLDLRAQVLGQYVFVDQLLSREAPASINAGYPSTSLAPECRWCWSDSCQIGLRDDGSAADKSPVIGSSAELPAAGEVAATGRPVR